MARRPRGRGLDLGMVSGTTRGSVSPVWLTRPQPGIFCKSYRCHSMACLDRPGLEFGDKIILPQEAFQEAHRLRLKLPLLFKLVNQSGIMGAAGPSPCQFCGVLEFSAPDDQVYLPYWLMQNLLLAEGSRVELRSMLHPPAGSFVRFKPHDNAFLDLAARQGPKALMEAALRRYSVLSEGATVLVQHEGDNFYLDVAEVRTFVSSAAAADPNGKCKRGHASSKIAAENALATSARSSSGDGGAPTEKAGSGRKTNLRGPEKAFQHGGDGDDGGGGGGNDNGEALLSNGGRRVRLVSLLGDLDLEVEFCSPRAPLPRVPRLSSPSSPLPTFQEVADVTAGYLPDAQGSPCKGVAQEVDDDGVTDKAATAGRIVPQASTRTALWRSPESPSVVRALPAEAVGSGKSHHASVVEERQMLCGSGSGGGGGGGFAPPLPAPARAMKSSDCQGSVSAMSALERSRRGAGQLGIRPPVPPSMRVSSVVSRCQAFPGNGLSLLGMTAHATPSAGGQETESASAVSVADLAHHQRPGKGDSLQDGVDSSACQAVPKENERSVGTSWGVRRADDAAGATALDGTISSCCSDGRLGGLPCGSDGQILSNGLSSSRRETGEVAMGVSAAATAIKVCRSSPAQPTGGSSLAIRGIDKAAEGGLAEAAEASVCGSCGKAIPVANLCLHELRCNPSTAARQRRLLRPSPSAQELSAPPARSFVLAAPSSYKACSTGKGGAGVSSPQPPSRLREEEEIDENEGRKTVGGSARASVLEFPCAYCGLTFRSASAASDHEEFCSTRTDRCQRCLVHVTRSDAESHRRPGGECDATIAAAVAQEAQLRAAGAAGGGAGGRWCCGVGSGGGGKDETPGVEVNGSNGGGGGVAVVRDICGTATMGGRFDALLAEAVSSSREASAALKDARTKNEARMAEATATVGTIATATATATAASALPRQREGDESGVASPKPNGVGEAAPSGRRLSPHPPEKGSGKEEGEIGVGYVSHLYGHCWTCLRCTLVNPHGSGTCDACGSVAPVRGKSGVELSPGRCRGGGRMETRPFYTYFGQDFASETRSTMKVVAPIPQAVGTQLPKKERAAGSKEVSVTRIGAEACGANSVTARASGAPIDGMSVQGRAGCSISPPSATSVGLAVAEPFAQELVPPTAEAGPSKARGVSRSIRIAPPALALAKARLASVERSKSRMNSGPTEQQQQPPPSRKPVHTTSTSANRAVHRLLAAHASSSPMPGVACAGSAFPALVRAIPGVGAASAASVSVSAVVADRAGPGARSRTSPATLAANESHPPLYRGTATTTTATITTTRESVTSVQQRRQQSDRRRRRRGEQKRDASPRAKWDKKGHTKRQLGQRTERKSVLKNIMGPPRRLGGVHRSPRLRYASLSLPPSPTSMLPPIDSNTVEGVAAAADAAAEESPAPMPSSSPTPITGTRSMRAATLIVRHSQRDGSQDEGGELARTTSPSSLSRSLKFSFGAGSGRGGGVLAGEGRGISIDARPSPPPVTAPPFDTSLSIRGRGRGNGAAFREDLLNGSGGDSGRANDSCAAAGEASAAEGSSRAPPGQERKWNPSFSRGRVLGDGGSESVGAWGRRKGVVEGSRVGMRVGVRVGDAPLMIRRHVSHTRLLEPLLAG